MRYQCLRCGKVGKFKTSAEAFAASWDVAPYFTVGPLCPNCPTVRYLEEMGRKGGR